MDWALKTGANALEMDLLFNSEGTPTDFFHVCNCHCLVNTGTCPYPMGNFCEGSRNASEVLSYFMSHKAMAQVGFIELDCKTGGVTDLMRAGQNAVHMLETELFEKGYKGNVVVSLYYKAHFHSSLVHAAMKSPYQSQIFMSCERAVPIINEFTSSAIKADYFERAEILTQTNLNYNQKIFSIGAGVCFQDIQHFYTEIVLGRINSAKGLFSHVQVWTVNSEADFDSYYDLGARAFITDNMLGVISWASKRGYPLYRLGETVRRGGSNVSPSEVVTEVGKCECAEREGGCVITTPAPPYSACQCGEGCSGRVVGCRDVESRRCTSPDNSLAACLLGSGQCGGYPRSCSCALNGTLCTLSETDIPDCTCQCELGEGSRCVLDVYDCIVKSKCCKLANTIVYVILMIIVRLSF